MILLKKDKGGLTRSAGSGNGSRRSSGNSGNSGGSRVTLTDCREQKTNDLGEECTRENLPGVLEVAMEADDEGKEREGTETVVEEPVKDSTAVEQHEKTLKV